MNARDFLTKVIAWPGPDDPGFAALVWWSPNPEITDVKNPRHKLWSSRCFRDPDAMVNFAGFLMTKPNNKDIYFCTALLNEHGVPTRSGKAYKAKRLISNVLNHKVVFCDIDIKDKGYASHIDAFAAITEAVDKGALPKPDLFVNSGGGIHVYWILPRPCGPDEWMNYAGGIAGKLVNAGIRFDQQCTVDQVRVLRLPQTLNHKFTPPRAVKCWG